MRRRSATSNRPMADAMTTAASAVLRQVLQQVRREHQQQRDRERAHDAGQLGPRAGGLGHRRARRAAADRKALEESGGQVGDAEADHLLVRIDRRAQARGIGAREHARVGERHERDGDAAHQDRHQIVDANERQAWHRAAPAAAGRAPRCRRASRDRTAATTTVAATTAIRMPGHARPALQEQDQRERAAADRERHDIRAPGQHLLDDAHACRSGPSAVDGEAKSFGIWLSSTVSAMPFM